MYLQDLDGGVHLKGGSRNGIYGLYGCLSQKNDSVSRGMRDLLPEAWHHLASSSSAVVTMSAEGS